MSERAGCSQEPACFVTLTRGEASTAGTGAKWETQGSPPLHAAAPSLHASASTDRPLLYCYRTRSGPDRSLQNSISGHSTLQRGQKCPERWILCQVELCWPTSLRPAQESCQTVPDQPNWCWAGDPRWCSARGVCARSPCRECSRHAARCRIIESKRSTRRPTELTWRARRTEAATRSRERSTQSAKRRENGGVARLRAGVNIL